MKFTIALSRWGYSMPNMPVYTAVFEYVGLCRVNLERQRRYKIQVSDVYEDGEKIFDIAYLEKPPDFYNTVGELKRGERVRWSAETIYSIPENFERVYKMKNTRFTPRKHEMHSAMDSFISIHGVMTDYNDNSRRP